MWGNDDVFHQKYTIPTVKQGAGSIILWGEGLKANISSYIYQSMLEQKPSDSWEKSPKAK